MKALVYILVAIVTLLDILGLIDLPLYASIGFFTVMLLIVLDTIFDGSKNTKDQS